MTYQRQMTDERFDAELKAARQDLSKFRQSTLKQERIIKEAIKNKYHSLSKKACTVYIKFKAAGFSDFAADSMCRQAHRYNINPNLDLQQILNAVKAKSAFKPNSTNSKGPDGPGVIPDQQFSPSSYSSDYDSCLKSLESLLVDPERAAEECSTQYKGTGNRGGMTWTTPPIKGPSNFTVRKATGSLAIRTHNASVSNQDTIPAWCIISTSEEVASRPRNKSIYNNNLKSASLDELKSYHDAISEDISTTMRSRAENRVNEISQQRTKSAKYEGKSSWAIACNL
jgi:hypothetical protein